MSVVMQTQVQKMASGPFCVFAFCVTIDTMLNFDTKVDLNQNSTCEKTLTRTNRRDNSKRSLKEGTIKLTM